MKPANGIELGHGRSFFYIKGKAYEIVQNENEAEQFIKLIQSHSLIPTETTALRIIFTLTPSDAEHWEGIMPGTLKPLY